MDCDRSSAKTSVDSYCAPVGVSTTGLARAAAPSAGPVAADSVAVDAAAPVRPVTGLGQEVGDVSSRAGARIADPHVLLVVALGGGLGALARYGFALWLPTQPDGFPVATFAVNVIGCAAMGVLMVLVTEVWVAHRLLRPFLGVGVLGGFTTFSTYSAEIRTLLESGAVGMGLGYLGATMVTCLAAVVAGMAGARWVTGSVR